MGNGVMQQDQQTTSARNDRRSDFELLVLDAIGALVRSRSPSSSIAMDDTAAKIMSFIEMSAVQRRERLERVAVLRMRERREGRA